MKPILFNTEMVRAILSGKKTQTRRMVKCQPIAPLSPGIRRDPVGIFFSWYEEGLRNLLTQRPAYQPGDVLYVRETWNVNNLREEGDKYEVGFIYKAADAPDYDFRWVETTPEAYEKYEDGMSLYFDKWRPSVHMPKEAARIFLRVTDVHVERLQHITRDDAISEGCNAAIPVLEFQGIWDSTIKPADRNRYGWNANPWVWAICFERIPKEDTPCM